MIAAVCKRHGIVACHQCNPRIELNQVFELLGIKEILKWI